MNFNKYQKISRRTAIYPKKGKNFIYPTLGLAGETGEVIEKIKHALRDDRGKFDKKVKEEIVKELGDVLWYIAQLSSELKISLDRVASLNLKKLLSRQKRSKLHGRGDNR